MAPITMSSMLGWVAPVTATESPSQESPAVIQRTSISRGGCAVSLAMRCSPWSERAGYGTAPRTRQRVTLNPSADPRELLSGKHQKQAISANRGPDPNSSRKVGDDLADLRRALPQRVCAHGVQQRG